MVRELIEDTVAGDGDLEDWGLEVFDDFFSNIGDELFPETGGLADPERLANSFSGPAR